MKKVVLVCMAGLMVVTVFGLFLIAGCLSPEINLFTDASSPLVERTIEGKAKQKILVITVEGIISDKRRDKFMHSEPSMLEEVVSQLKLAAKDDQIKAVILKVNSPGGTTTASDILYHEIMEYKKHTGATVIASMMDVAASGGYYISLAADRIMAHPTTITGSVGVISVNPRIEGMMKLIGVDVTVTKSGEAKDMGSLFRAMTDEERKIIQGLINESADRFLGLVKKHRKLDDDQLKEVATARVYSAKGAKEAGLVDQIGYLDDTVKEAIRMAGLPEDAKVVAFRRSHYSNDNIYNTSSMQGPRQTPLTALGLPDMGLAFSPGLYYLWMPGGK